MKRLGLLLIVVLISMLMAGCVTNKMRTTRILPDGTKLIYEFDTVAIGQDMTASDIKVTLDPEGKTTIKAGAVDTITSEVTTDAAMVVVEALKIMLPYMVAPVPPPTP